MVRGRARAGAIAAVLCLGALAPLDASAGPLRPRIGSIDPTEVSVGSPSTTVTITGSGFVPPRERRGVEAGSMVIADGDRIAATVVDQETIRATLPSSYFLRPRAVWLMVANGVATGGSWVPVSWSNVAELDVVQRIASLSISTWQEEIAVNDCLYFNVVARDGAGKDMSPAGLEITLSSDDISTTFPDDGGLRFFEEECEGTEISSTGMDENRKLFGATRSAPATVRVTARAGDYVGTSDPVRIVGGYVSGRVLDDAGRPVQGATVHVGWASTPMTVGTMPGGMPPWRSLYPNTGDYPYASIGPAIATTDVDGSYRTIAIAPMTYLLYVSPPPSSGLAGTWLGGARTAWDAHRTRVVDDGEARDVDALLGPGGDVAGTVASGGEPVVVEVVQPDTGRPVAARAAAEDGSYVVPGVPPGAYAVRFRPQDGSVMDVWSGNARDLSSAQRITVDVGRTTSGVDATSPRGARIGGRVTVDGEAAPLYGDIALYDAETGNRVAHDYASETSVFTLGPAVRAGRYKLYVNARWENFIGGWYGGSSFADARVIDVSEGATLSLEVPLGRGSVIKGTVSEAPPDVLGGKVNPLGGVQVFVYPAGRDEIVAWGYTDARGAFTTTGLHPGRYEVRADPVQRYYRSTHAAEWHPGVESRRDAEVVEIGSEQTRVINFALDMGGSISGVVRDPSGTPLHPDEGAVVEVVRIDEPDRSYALVEADGRYTVTGLADGTYKVRVHAWERGWMSTWYPAAASEGAATPIVVRQASRADGVDIAFGNISRMTGRIDQTSARGPSWGWADIVDASSGEPVAYGWVEQDGTWWSSYLRAGTYQVRFQSSGDHAPIWFGGGRTRAEAAAIVVGDGVVVEGINAAFGAGRRMHGVVRAEHSGAPVGGVTVSIVDAATGERLGTAATWPDGRFISSPLLPGEHKIVFNEVDWNYVDVLGVEWFREAATEDAADPVRIGADADLFGIDATLPLSP